MAKQPTSPLRTRMRRNESEPMQPAPPDALANLSIDELQRLIAEAAYYRAEQRGFAPGGEMEDWLQAETQIRISSRRSGDLDS